MSYCKKVVILLVTVCLLVFPGCGKPNKSDFDKDSFILESDSLSIYELTPNAGYQLIFHTDDSEYTHKVVNAVTSIVKVIDPQESLDLSMTYRIVFNDEVFVSIDYDENDYQKKQPVYMRLYDKYLFAMSDELVELIYPVINEYKYKITVVE